MNSTLNLIANRRSTRSYSSQPLTAEEKDLIIQAALRAPTAGNMMLYSIIEVEDQAIKDQLSRTCDNQPFIAKARYVLLFLADYQRWYDYYLQSGVEQRCLELNRTHRLPQEGDLLLACCDALIAAQTAVLAAESLGIGSCYIGDILENYELHRQMFSLPPYVIPVTLLCFGRPALDNPIGDLTPRFDREFIVSKNSYNHQNAAQLEKMFETLQNRYFASGRYSAGAQNLGQHYYFKKFISDFSVEMSRSVKEMLKNWRG
ncbi:MAG: nitroreductase family protein [Anaerolineaceae bacterium]|nr:nitroreductase family protein [Anaerolineaceae bacterium]